MPVAAEKHDTLRTVPGSVKQKAKGTFGRLFKHLRSDDDGKLRLSIRRRKSIPLFVSSAIAAEEPPTGTSLSENPRRYSAFVDSGYGTNKEDAQSLNDNNHSSGSSKSHCKKEFLANRKQSTIPASNDVSNQFAELCDLVRCNLKMDKLRSQSGNHYSSADETDDSVDPELRQHLTVPITTFRSVDSLKEISTATRRTRAIAAENTVSLPAPQDSSETIIRPSESAALVRVRTKEVKGDENTKEGSSFEDFSHLEWVDEAGQIQSRVCKPPKTMDGLLKNSDKPSARTDRIPNPLIIDTNSEEDAANKSDDPEPIDERNLHEGFLGYLVMPVSGPRSLVRTYGRDFYEYPPDEPTRSIRPTRNDASEDGINKTFPLYDGSFSVRPSQTAAGGTDGRTNPKTYGAEREMQLALVCEEIHHRGLPAPQWISFPAKTNSPHNSAGAQFRTIRWKDLGASDTTSVKTNSGFEDLTDVAYENGIDRSKTQWRWEASLGKLLRLREHYGAAMIKEGEDVDLKCGERLGEQLRCGEPCDGIPKGTHTKSFKSFKRPWR